MNKETKIPPFNFIVLNVAVALLAHLFLIREISASNVGTNTG